MLQQTSCEHKEGSTGGRRSLGPGVAEPTTHRQAPVQEIFPGRQGFPGNH